MSSLGFEDRTRSPAAATALPPDTRRGHTTRGVNAIPTYWREYRRAHAQYEERNRTQQRSRDVRRRERRLAKMDASTRVFPVPSGIYWLAPAAAQ